MSQEERRWSRKERDEIEALARRAARDAVKELLETDHHPEDAGIERRTALKIGGAVGGTAVLSALSAGRATASADGAKAERTHQPVTQQQQANNGSGNSAGTHLLQLIEGQWNRWKNNARIIAPPVPQHGTHGPAVTYEEKIYCFGNDHANNPQFLVYNIKNASWETKSLPSRLESTPLGNGGAALDRGSETIYILNNNGFFAYEIDNDRFVDPGDDPSVVNGRPGLATFNGDVYRIGGINNASDPTSSVERFDGNEWRAAPDLSTPRRDLTAATYDGRIYAIGGNNGNPLSALTTVESLDPSDTSPEWNTGEPLPVDTSGAGVTIVDDKLVVFGGVANRTQIFDGSGWSVYPTPHEEGSISPAVGSAGDPKAAGNVKNGTTVFVFGSRELGSPFRADAFGVGTPLKEGDDNGDGNGGNGQGNGDNDND